MEIFVLLLAVATIFILILAIQSVQRSRRTNYTPNTFAIYQTEPIRDAGCGGCVLGLALLVLPIGLYWRVGWLLALCASAIAIGFVLTMLTLLRERRRQQLEKKSHARIELNESEITFYDTNGALTHHISWTDIGELARYQGIDDDKQWFDDCVLHLKNGQEIVLKGFIQRKKKLLKSIQYRTELEFVYRKNSSRHSRSISS